MNIQRIVVGDGNCWMPNMPPRDCWKIPGMIGFCNEENNTNDTAATNYQYADISKGSRDNKAGL